MYTGAALSFGLIRACRSGLVLYSSVLSDPGGENDGSSAIFERSLLECVWKSAIQNCSWIFQGHWVNPSHYVKLFWALWVQLLAPLNVFNTLRLRQNGRHFADDIFKCIFLNENVWIPIEISLKFVPKDPINNIPALVQIMAWRQPGDKS